MAAVKQTKVHVERKFLEAVSQFLNALSRASFDLKFLLNELCEGCSRTNRVEKKIKQHKSNIQLANFILQ